MPTKVVKVIKARRKRKSRLLKPAADYPIDYFVAVLGRILMGGFFLWNGIDAILNLPATIATFMPLFAAQASVVAIMAVSIEILAGLALITGFATRTAALILVFFVIVTASVLTNFGDQTQMAMFFRNMAIVGGLLYMASAQPKIS